MKRVLLPILALLFAMPLLPAQDEVALYVRPDVESSVIARVPPDAPVIRQSRPVEDTPKAERGWRTATFVDTFTGYVDPKMIQSDYTIAPATLIYERPAPTSPVLATSDPNVPVRVKSVSPFWAEVELTQRVAVYFIESPATRSAREAARSTTDATPPPPPADAGPAETVEPSDDAMALLRAEATGRTRPERAQSTSGTADVVISEPIEVETAQPSPPPPEPPAPTEPTPAPEPAPRPAPAQPPEPGPQPAPPEPQPRPVEPEPAEAGPQRPATLAPVTIEERRPRPKTVAHRWTGILRERGNGFFGFRQHDEYDYELVGPDGSVIAYVDTGQAILFEPVNAFFERRVSIHGRPRSLGGEAGDPAFVIDARTITLR